MTDAIGWAVVALVLGIVPILLVSALHHSLTKKPVEDKYRGMSSGGLGGGFDAVWSPSAHEAGMERDREQRRSVPAPTPDKGPGRMDHDRIVIELDRI